MWYFLQKYCRKKTINMWQPISIFIDFQKYSSIYTLIYVQNHQFSWKMFKIFSKVIFLIYNTINIDIYRLLSIFTVLRQSIFINMYLDVCWLIFIKFKKYLRFSWKLKKNNFHGNKDRYLSTSILAFANSYKYYRYISTRTDYFDIFLNNISEISVKFREA